jgi:hypothetical protein
VTAAVRSDCSTALACAARATPKQTIVGCSTRERGGEFCIALQVAQDLAAVLIDLSRSRRGEAMGLEVIE